MWVSNVRILEIRCWLNQCYHYSNTGKLVTDTYLVELSQCLVVIYNVASYENKSGQSININIKLINLSGGHSLIFIFFLSFFLVQWRSTKVSIVFLLLEHCHLLRKAVLAETKIRTMHDDVIKWKHFPRKWPFVRGIHRSPVNSPHKGQWRGALMFSLICAWINDWVNNREAGDLRRYRAHYDVITMGMYALTH